MSLIEVRGLHHTYSTGVTALQGVDFDLHAGETVILLGPNGSGKTTFVLHLIGLLETTRGVVRVGGLEVTGPNLRKVRQKAGFLFQDPDEQLFMPTVLDDVAFGPLNHGTAPAEARRKALAELERVGMAHAADRAPYHLSSGEKRRVALAGVLAMDPEILIFDEPTTYLDPPGQKLLARILAELPQAKIIVTHDLAWARRWGTRAVFFEGGRVAGEGTVEEMIRRFDWE